ncbi:Uncharacterised protein [Mannheimia haemolytica]|uniref:Filamentation induced by cAMP protein Fic-like C-terminal domain-containing protein n=1 Tax=Mannheimia haemolytica TaxID=75985 RepID=A0A378MTT1_MANHA|nr:Uncharacterised protein [Mannheimia haemolytica]
MIILIHLSTNLIKLVRVRAPPRRKSKVKQVKQLPQNKANQITPEVNRLLSVLLEPMKSKEIMKKLRLKDDKHFRMQYLKPALTLGVIEMQFQKTQNTVIKDTLRNNNRLLRIKNESPTAKKRNPTTSNPRQARSTRSNDEPASELLCQIQAEKDRLIAEGKIKKNKKTADKAPYTIEPPFEIPESWVWVRLGDICLKITDGTHHSPQISIRVIFLYITAKKYKERWIRLSKLAM